jgi:hypothetical protein
VVEKYSLGGTEWSNKAATIGWLDGLNGADVTCPGGSGATCNDFIISAVALAAASWSGSSEISINYNSTTPDIAVRFADLGTGTTLGSAAQPGSGGDASVNNQKQWSVGFVAGSLPAGRTDLESLLRGTVITVGPDATTGNRGSSTPTVASSASATPTPPRVPGPACREREPRSTWGPWPRTTSGRASSMLGSSATPWCPTAFACTRSTQRPRLRLILQ